MQEITMNEVDEVSGGNPFLLGFIASMALHAYLTK